MARFGVGRTSIREALFSLQKLGLVTSGNGTRHRVTAPTADVLIRMLSGAVRQLLLRPGGVQQLQDARAFLEIGLARNAASKATKKDLDRLRGALEANRAAIDDIDAFERTDVAFHYVLAEIARNTIYTSIHEGIVSWLHEQRTTTLKRPGQNATAYEAHARIFKAVADRDPDAAEAAMRAHLDQVAGTYWTMMRQAAAAWSGARKAG
jgi:GntR family transcriptional regulator, sialic acid-inducible nan operon repressor